MGPVFELIEEYDSGGGFRTNFDGNWLLFQFCRTCLNVRDTAGPLRSSIGQKYGNMSCVSLDRPSVSSLSDPWRSFNFVCRSLDALDTPVFELYTVWFVCNQPFPPPLLCAEAFARSFPFTMQVQVIQGMGPGVFSHHHHHHFHFFVFFFFIRPTAMLISPFASSSKITVEGPIAMPPHLYNIHKRALGFTAIPGFFLYSFFCCFLTFKA